MRTWLLSVLCSGILGCGGGGSDTDDECDWAESGWEVQYCKEGEAEEETPTCDRDWSGLSVAGNCPSEWYGALNGCDCGCWPGTIRN